MMVMAILGSRVSKENWSNLEQAFQKGSEKRQAGLEHSYLVHAPKRQIFGAFSRFGAVERLLMKCGNQLKPLWGC